MNWYRYVFIYSLLSEMYKITTILFEKLGLAVRKQPSKVVHPKWSALDVGLNSQVLPKLTYLNVVFRDSGPLGLLKDLFEEDIVDKIADRFSSLVNERIELG